MHLGGNQKWRGAGRDVWSPSNGEYLSRTTRQRRAPRILVVVVVVLIVNTLTGGPGSGVLESVMPVSVMPVMPSPIPAAPDADLAAPSAASPVSIGDDDPGLAMFDQPDMLPGETTENCLVVTYSGTLLPADISLYGSAAGTGLDTYLDMTIEVGTGGRFGDCDGFTSAATVFSGTVAEFKAASTNSANGLSVWSPTTTPESRTYRFALTLQDDNTAQGKTASISLTWKAQNR